MIERYAQLIDDGRLRLSSPPHQNTISEWMNDEQITPVLEGMLRMTSEPFRRREIGSIADASKVSQSSLAHARLVDYGEDERPNADWSRVHALVGVETMVIMAVRFSGTRGEGTHEKNFVEELVGDALRTFDLSFFLGDKGYLSEDILGWLWNKGLKAAIPVKKRWNASTKSHCPEAAKALVMWYDQRRREFDEVYRLRAKIEGLFSLLNRIAGGHLLSRGRPRTIPNAIDPCTAWKNELLAKMIYLNLRTTVTLEEETAVTINYLVPERCFPAPTDPLLKAHI
jgi:Transposase DDE domain